MKKVLGAVLILLLLCMSMAYADSAPGDTVTVTFRCTSAYGCAAVININYDSNVFQFVSATGGVSANANRAGILKFGSVGFDETITYTFRVKDTAPSGTYMISAILSECVDVDEQPVAASVTGSSTITIAGTSCKHTNTVVFSGKAATCTQEGSTERTLCVACGMIVRPSTVIPATGHTITAEVEPVTEVMAGQELPIRFIFECGDVENAVIKWTLDDASGAVVRAGVAADDADAWETVLKFSEAGAFNVGVSAGDSGYAQDVVMIVRSLEPAVLPEDLVEIQNEALINLDVVEFVLPEGVRAIGSRAFAGNEQLALVNIPESVTAIAADAFDGCTALTLLCKEGSYGEVYAIANEIPYVIW